MDRDPEAACEMCGAPLRLPAQGRGGLERAIPLLCSACAEEESASYRPRSRGLHRAAILLSVGGFVLTLSIFADWLQFGRSRGFGWHQFAGVGLAGVLLLIGAVMRVATVSVIGVIVGGLAILADWLGFGNAEGFGAHQKAGVLAGVLLIVVGLLVARLARGEADAG